MQGLVAEIPSLFGIFVYNNLTSLVTKIELTGTEKFTLLMKFRLKPSSAIFL